jgi:predicted O-methyltransferase YrrM
LDRKSNRHGQENTVLKILEEIEQTAKRQSLPSIGPIKGKIIEEVIREQKPKKVLEIGTLHGYSAILITNTILSEKIKNENFATENSLSEPILIAWRRIKKLQP